MVYGIQAWTSMYNPSIAAMEPAELLSCRKALAEPEGAAAKKMQNVEALVAGCSTPFYCGEEATLADYHLFCWLSFIRTGCDTAIRARSYF